MNKQRNFKNVNYCEPFEEHLGVGIFLFDTGFYLICGQSEIR